MWDSGCDCKPTRYGHRHWGAKMSEWIEWNPWSSSKADDEDFVEVERENGQSDCRYARLLDWGHYGTEYDIAKYRVISKATPSFARGECTCPGGVCQKSIAVEGGTICGFDAKKASALDTQIGGDHYKKLKIQPMEYSMANGLNACQHTAIKYITRYKDKGTAMQDLDKAIHCIELLKDFVRKEETK